MNPMDSPLVAIVDDDELFRRSVERVVGSADFRVEAFGSAEDFLERGNLDGTACAILDMRLPGLNGFDLQRWLISRPRPMPIVFVSGREDAVMRANALRAGAIAIPEEAVRQQHTARRSTSSDHIASWRLEGVMQATVDDRDIPATTQPVPQVRGSSRGRQMPDGIVGHAPRFEEVLERIKGSTAMKGEENRDDAALHGQTARPSRFTERSMSVPELIGSHPRFAAVLEDVRTVAAADCAVLIQGETGTGKELIARAIHEASARRHHRYVTVNCAAIPTALLESELFGHERGAFTGAITSKMGRFQVADRGTLFLDEIGELAIELQPKLLRAIQEQEFERVGSAHTTRVDVRIVAATNQNLGPMVAERRFRMDLYYRLNVFPITLPPLRDRTGDIPSLVHHFVRTAASRNRKSIARVPDEVMAALIKYDWPGNIRELQNFIERSVILTRGAELQAPVAELANKRLPIPAVRTLADAERAHIISTLRKTNWAVGGRNGAAARLGLVRTTLIAKMRKLGISRETADQFGEALDPCEQVLVS